MTPTSDFEIYVPVYDTIPEEWEDARQFLIEQLREITDGVNARDYGTYIDEEMLNGQAWLPGTVDPTKYRSVFRKVIDIVGLPDFGAVSPKNIAHGLTFSENTCITRLYGTASNPGVASLTKGIPLPFIDKPADANIGIEIDSTNIIITGDGATDYSAYTCAYVVVEWIDED